MNSLLRFSLAVVLLPTALLTAPISASAQEEMREGRNYVGITGTRLNHRSVDNELTGQGWSSMAGLVLGTHISENFHVELRAGGGVAPGDVEGQLEVNIDYYASWYIGGHLPITSYSNAYAQFGFTHLKGESKLTPFGQYVVDTPQDELPPALRGRTYEEVSEMDYPDSSFSTSWLFGLDFEVIDDGFLFLEAGKFFEDTGTNANVFHYTSGLKYEF